MTNPLLQYSTKLPGRIFQLPSKGIFYPPGVLAPSVKDGEIKVLPMSALAEMKLRSADLLFSGQALSEVCNECIPEVLQPNMLVSHDVDAIFCYLKIVTYGSEMQIKSIHDCQGAQYYDYTVNIENIVMDPRNGALMNHDILYQVKLDNFTVKLRPVAFADTLEMTHLRNDLEKSLGDTGQVNSIMMAKMIVRDLMSAIKTVEVQYEENGEKKVQVVTEKKHIEEWVATLPKKQVDEIIKQSKLSNEWGYKLSTDLHCKDCKEIYSHDLQIDPISFFSGLSVHVTARRSTI